MRILNVRFDEVNEAEAIHRVRCFLKDSTPHFIFTPNPEMLVDANRDERFREVLNSGHLNLADGVGVTLASRGRLRRIPGADFMLAVCQLAEDSGASVYLLGSGSDETVRRTKLELEKKFPRLRLVGFHAGPQIVEALTGRRKVLVINPEENEAVLGNIKAARPDILFTAFSHGKQEKWIADYVPLLPCVRVAMGVGGAFDFIAGKVKRAPRPLRRLGLEWLWRLWREPRRFCRIWKATAVFPYLWLKTKDR